jgi:hypothetical protein
VSVSDCACIFVSEHALCLLVIVLEYLLVSMPCVLVIVLVYLLVSMPCVCK